MSLLLTLDKRVQLLFVGVVSWFLGNLFCCSGLMNGWLAFITFWIVGSLLYMYFATQRLGTEGKAVLITGCDTGFGYKLALHLDSLGFRVFACCLLADKEGDGAKALEENGSENLHVLQMDVTSEEEVKAARETVDKLLPDDECLWGIANNAGLSTFGNVEWVPISSYKRIADVNIFGTINVTKAFLPLIRKAKGRVVNVASMLGRMGPPMRSPYVVSKYAVEGLNDCLRQEMKPYGVDVILLEPGNFIIATSIITEETVVKEGEKMWKSMTEEVKNFYGEENFKDQIDIMKTYVTVGDIDVSPVMNSFEEALTQKYPQTRYQPMSLYYKMRIMAATHLPEWAYDMIYVGCLDK